MSIQKALVVDDSKSARFSIKKMLEKMSVGVDFAESAEEALEYLVRSENDKQPDIIFMDHLMPGMDGFEATKAIKENKNWASIPVVMCTSKEGSDYLAQAQSYGAIDILPKPASLSQITRILDQLGGTPETKVKVESDAAIIASTQTITPVRSNANPTISAGMSRDAIEKLAKDTANGVAKNTLEKIVEDRLRQFRRELLIECENVAQEAATKAIKQITTELQQDVIRSCKPQLNDIATDASQNIANSLFDTKFSELSNHIMQQVNNQLADINQEQRKSHEIDPGLMEEVRNTSRLVAEQKAVETAENIARNFAVKTTTETFNTLADKLNNDLSEKIQQSLLENSKRSQRSGLFLSIIAILVAATAIYLQTI